MFTQYSNIGRFLAFVGGGIAALALSTGAQAQVPGTTADAGKIAFVSTRDRGISQVYVMNADGSNQTNLTRSGINEYDPAFSRDGSKIVFTSTRAGNLEIYVMNADGTEQTRLTNSPGLDSSPAFSPDGTKIAFVSDRDGDREVFLMNADGTGQTRLTSNPSTPGFLGGDYAPTFTPDGTHIVFESYHSNSYYDLEQMNLDGSGRVLIAHIAGDGIAPSVSPDGSRIVFGGAHFANQVAVVSTDGTGLVTLAAGGFNGYPTFDLSGSRIAFTSDRALPDTTTSSGSQQIFVVDAADGSAPIALTDAATGGANYAPSWAPGAVPAPAVPVPAPAPPVVGPSLVSLSLNPSSVIGGSNSSGTVKLDVPAPMGGVLVVLSSGNPALAAVPESVLVPEGAYRATFSIATRPVAGSAAIDIEASLGSIIRRATLNLTPPVAPSMDAIAIQKAEYTASKRQIQVQATSTNASASLSLYVASTGALIGTLTPGSGGRFQGQFTVMSKPDSITIRSSAGGTATVRVTLK